MKRFIFSLLMSSAWLPMAAPAAAKADEPGRDGVVQARVENVNWVRRRPYVYARRYAYRPYYYGDYYSGYRYYRPNYWYGGRPYGYGTRPGFYYNGPRVGVQVGGFVY